MQAVAALDRDSFTHPRFGTKLDAIGYGLLIPGFFVVSGVRPDGSGLVHSPEQLLPVSMLVLLLSRGLPTMLYVRRLGRIGWRFVTKSSAAETVAP